MKKFGVVDVVLAVLVVAGVAANIYVYGFYNKDAPDVSGASEVSDTSEVNPEASGRPAVTAQTPPNTVASPPKDQNTPAPGVTETHTPEPPAPEPEESVVNTLVYTLGSLNVTVNGQEAAIDKLGSAPYFQSGVSMLPLRATYEILGGSIELDSSTGYVAAVFLDTSLKVKAGETGAEINGASAELSVAPIAKGGTTYLPARSIADALGAELIWDGTARTITLEIPSETLIDASSLLPPA